MEWNLIIMALPLPGFELGYQIPKAAMLPAELNLQDPRGNSLFKGHCHDEGQTQEGKRYEPFKVFIYDVIQGSCCMMG